MPVPGQISLVVRDLSRSIAFYRLLGWDIPEPSGPHVSIPFEDDLSLVQRMSAAGYAIRQVPYDTFWGARFAIVDDPDGYQIGFISPSLSERRFWPPTDAPTANMT